MFNFYQINENSEIRTRDRLVIKALIPCQKTISTQKLKLLGEFSKYNLYYSLPSLSLIYKKKITCLNRYSLLHAPLRRIVSLPTCAFLSKCMYACTRVVSPVRGARIRKWREGQLIKEEEGDLT